MTKFRPRQEILDVFWTISDGNDDQRNAGAVKLARLINTSEDSEKAQLLQYCLDRLVRGLSSGRKYARVGFSVALVQLLKENEQVSTNSVLSTIRNKLKTGGPEKKLQSEIGGILLGKAFATSALIRAGRVEKLSGDVLSSMVAELFSISDRKSYLKAVCDKVTRDLLQQVSADVFAEKVWPKIKDKMSEGWKSCTLDRVAVLLMCRARFPEVVRKKFLRKLWGFPVLSEDNDDKLLAAVLASHPRSDVLSENILPQMLETGRDPLSIWMAVGEKLLEQVSEKTGKTMTYQQLGLKFAAKLVSSNIQDNQAVDIMLSPGLTKCMFNSDVKRNNPGAADSDYLYQQICQRLAGGRISVLSVVERIWKLEASMLQQQQSGVAGLVKSNNFVHFLDLMSQEEAEQYGHVLVAMVMGNDPWSVMSHDAPTKLKQLECCLRQLHHLSISQSHIMAETMQSSILALFLRLACFSVTTATKDIEHCGSCINLQETDTARKLSEVFFHKVLDSLFALLTSKQKNWEMLSSRLDMLYGLACYVQTLLESDAVVPIKLVLPEVQVQWRALVKFCKKLRKNSNAENQELHSAFLLLALFLGFYMLTDAKMAMDMLQDVYICCHKADGAGQEDNGDENEPKWIEVMTDLLLKIMSLSSHLGRVIAAIVFRLLSAHVTPSAVALITEVIIPSKSSGDNLADVLMDVDDHDEDEDVSSSDDDGEASDNSSNHEDGEANDNSSSQELEDATPVNGQAPKTGAGDHSEDEESLPDMSDSEMFKMDAMLAEVFRQKQKSGKKARDEKKQEMINFQIRVLDLVEILIKGPRCGDFVISLLKPLCLLMIKTTAPGSQVLAEKAKSLFLMIKSNYKALKDSLHSVEDQTLLFDELLQLASKVTDKRCLQQLSIACYMLANIQIEGSQAQVSSGPCVERIMNALDRVISKKSCKPHVAFFNMLLECDPIQFQELGPKLVDRLKDESVRPQGRMICCLVLASLCKKTESTKDTSLLAMKQWMTEAAEAVTQIMFSLDKVMFYKDVLTLAAAIQARQDILLPELPFGNNVKEHLLKLKSKFNTDIKRLAGRVISSIDQQNGQVKSNRKRKHDHSAGASSPATKKVSS